MCGIVVTITSDNPEVCRDGEPSLLENLIASRGPDCCPGTRLFPVRDSQWKLIAQGSTLWTQGESPTSQPLTTQRGSFLLWNGDAYDYPSAQRLLSDSHSVLQDIEVNREPLNVLTRVLGPYAFIYYDPDSSSLWFGRDPIGRCSLVIHSSENKLVISSVIPRNLVCSEVPSHGIFQLSFESDSYKMYHYPWSDTSSVDISGCLPFDFTILDPIHHEILNRRKDHMDSEPHIQELYSRYNKEFLQPLEILPSLSRSEKVHSSIKTVLMHLQESVRRRVSTKPRWCLNCSAVKYSGNCEHCKVAILFSGGLDCTILALLTHQILEPSEPIDLLNVAFDKPTSKAAAAPDRVTGLVALDELKRIAPDRKWNMVEISIGEKELKEKVDHIADLIHPLNSILDESLGCALWFAARGDGLLNSTRYKSPARVVLVGMGADELFGGYSRHAKVFQQSGSWAELDKMLLTEVQNIGSRNLGRDNRVVSDHGRMMRVPYLDEALVSYVNSLPAWVRCCPCKELPRGVGDKTLLRLVAHTIGLRETSVQPKRALQFGSRIANSKEKGHHTSKKLTGPV